MKLILTQEVSGLGAPGDVVDVAAGYGRNYLIPRGFAMPWTRGAEKQIELIKRARSAREIRSLEDAKAVAGQLEGCACRCGGARAAAAGCSARSGPADIAAAVREAGGPELDRRRIEVRDPIKTVGGTRSRSGCTPRSAPPSTSRSSPASQPGLS